MQLLQLYCFLDQEGGSRNATVVVVLVVEISSLKIPKAFLIRSATKLCVHIRVHIRAYIQYRSTISDFKIIRN